MKRTMGKTSKKFPAFMMAAALLVNVPTGLMAQDDLLLSETEDVLNVNNDDLNIDGTFRRKTQADKLAEMRKKLEKKNEDMMHKKIEDIRMKEEAKLTRKLQKAFTGQLQAMDQVSTESAAPVKIEAPAPEEDESAGVKILPYFGVVNSSTEGIDLESKFHGGLDVEAHINSRFSIGLGLSYTRTDMTDYAQSNGFTSSAFTPFYNNYYAPTYGYGYGYNTGYYNTYNSFYNNGYYNAFGTQGRVIEHQNLGVNVNGKFFILDKKRIRPFIGLGIGYNRMKLNYADDGQNFTYQGFALGNEEYATSFVSAAALAGTEIHFTKNFGLNLEFRFSKGLTSGSDGQTGQTFAFNPDQERLTQMGKAMLKTNSFTLNAGFLVAF